GAARPAFSLPRDERSMKIAASIITSANTSNCALPETQAEACAPSQVPAIPGTPNHNRCRTETVPWRALSNAPTKATAPTMARELTMAVFSGNPARYTSTGTQRIEPPEPSSPNVRPTMAAPSRTVIGRLSIMAAINVVKRGDNAHCWSRDQLVMDRLGLARMRRHLLDFFA